MNQDIKAEWVAALRSGKYEQTNGALKDEDGFCCLGVLCDVVKDRVGLSWRKLEGSCVTLTMGDATGSLPTQVSIFAGLNTSPMVGKDSLIYLNDIKRLNFKAIADAIEAHL